MLTSHFKWNRFSQMGFTSVKTSSSLSVCEVMQQIPCVSKPCSLCNCQITDIRFTLEFLYHKCGTWAGISGVALGWFCSYLWQRVWTLKVLLLLLLLPTVHRPIHITHRWANSPNPPGVLRRVQCLCPGTLWNSCSNNLSLTSKSSGFCLILFSLYASFGPCLPKTQCFFNALQTTLNYIFSIFLYSPQTFTH